MHWLSRHRRLVVAAICAFWTGLIIAVHFYPNVPFVSAVWRQEQNYQDFLEREGRKTATNPNLVFLGIDEATIDTSSLLPEEIAGNRAFELMTAHSYPWSRELWALLLDRLFNAGARVVMFDLVFNPPNEGDPIFRDAIDRHRDRVVLGANFDAEHGMKFVMPNTALIPAPQIQDNRVGYVIFFPDPLDQKVRSIFYTMSDRLLVGQPPHPTQEVYYSLSARALIKLGVNVPLDFQPHQFRFSEEDAYQPHSLYEIFDPKLWQANYANGAFFKDKIVIVGAASKVVHDVVTTPMSPDTPGPVLHLQVIAATLARDFLHNTSERTDLILVLPCRGAGLGVDRLCPAAAGLSGCDHRDHGCLPRLRADGVRSLGPAPAGGAGADRISHERFALVRLRVCPGTPGKTAHPPDARALRLEKSRERDSR